MGTMALDQILKHRAQPMRVVNVANYYAAYNHQPVPGAYGDPWPAGAGWGERALPNPWQPTPSMSAVMPEGLNFPTQK